MEQQPAQDLFLIWDGEITTNMQDKQEKTFHLNSISVLVFLEPHNMSLESSTQKPLLSLIMILMLIFSNMQITESSVMHSKLFLLSQKKSENSKINLHTKFIFF